MTVNINQIASGLLRYIDNEIAEKSEGLLRWLSPLASEALVESYMPKIQSGLEMMHMMDEQGNIDIDLLYSKMCDIADKKGSVTEKIPLTNRQITFSKQDITALYRMIVG